MNKRIFILVVILSLMGVLETCVFVKGALSNQINYALISAIQEKSFAGGTKVLIGLDRQSDFVTYELPDPSRIIIDPISPVFSNLSKDLSFEKGLVSRIKIMEDRDARPSELDKTYYPVDFILLELREPTAYKILQQDHSIILEAGVSEEEVLKAMREWSEILKKREWTIWSPIKKAKLTTNVTQDIEYNRNFYGTNRRTKHVPKLISKLYPEFWFGMPLSRDLSRLRLNIYYKPTLTYYNKPGHFLGPRHDSNHYINPSLVYTSAKSSFTLSNAYTRANRTDLLDKNTVTTYDDYWEDTATGDFYYNLNNKNSLRLFYRFYALQYPGLYERWSQMSQEVSSTLERKLNATTTARLFYRFYVLQFPDIGLFGIWSEESQEVTPTLERKLNETTTAYLTGELKKYLRKTDFDSLSKKGIFGIRHKLFKTINTETSVTYTTTDFFKGIGGLAGRKDQDVLEVSSSLTRPLIKLSTLYLRYTFTKYYYGPPYLKYYGYISLYNRFPWKKITVTVPITANYTLEDFLKTKNKRTIGVEPSLGLNYAITKWLQTEFWYYYSTILASGGGDIHQRTLNNRLRFLLKYIF